MLGNDTLVLEKYLLVTGTIGTEVLQDAGQWRVWHLDLEEVVTEWNLASFSETRKMIG